MRWSNPISRLDFGPQLRGPATAAATATDSCQSRVCGRRRMLIVSLGKSYPPIHPGRVFAQTSLVFLGTRGVMMMKSGASKNIDHREGNEILE